jgi:hypothetical protein
VRDEADRFGAPGAAAVAAVCVAVFVAALTLLAAVGRSSGPSGRPIAVASGAPTDVTIVLVDVVGLRWADLDVLELPTLEAWTDVGASATVRAVARDTSPVEGATTVAAGARVGTTIGLEGAAAAEMGDAWSSSPTCAPAAAAAIASLADASLEGASVGSLADTLAAAGVSVSARGASLGGWIAAGADGCVARVDDLSAPIESGLTVVAADDLVGVADAATRRSALEAIDRRLARLAVPADAVVVVIGSSTTDAQPALTVAAAGLPVGAASNGSCSLTSASTRRSGNVQTIDVAPTVLEAFGLERPASMSGQPWRITDGGCTSVGGDGVTRADATALADAAERTAARDAAVGPVSVAMILAVMAAAVLAWRGSRGARAVAIVAAAIPLTSSIAGLTAWHQLSTPVVVVSTFAVAAVIASFANAFGSRLGACGAGSRRTAGLEVLAAATWLVLVVDLWSGGRLQIDTVFGSTPTTGGRFRGLGNLAFGLFGATAVWVVASGRYLVQRPSERRSAPRAEPTAQRRPLIWIWVGSVGLATVVAVGAPSLGSDVGGTLAIVPALVVVGSVVLGRTVRVGRIVVAGAAAVVVVVGFALWDRSRPEDQRTHLGRFADRLVDGGGGEIVRRKLAGSWAMFTSSPFSIAFGVALVVAVVGVVAQRQRFAAWLARTPPLAFVAPAWLVLAVIGTAVNDSGIAVPAMMSVVAVPSIIHAVVAPVRRGDVAGEVS